MLKLFEKIIYKESIIPKIELEEYKVKKLTNTEIIEE